jgi:hypothetical protein
MRHLIITALTFCAFLSAQVPTELYVNSLTGSDTANDGQSAAAPFATIGKALAEIDTAGGSIYVAPGTYSALSVTSDLGFTGYVNVVSTTPLASVIRGVSINYGSAQHDTPIRFLDCQITKDGTAVTLRGAHRVQLVNCYIRTDRHANGTSTFEALDMKDSEDVTVTGCWLTNCGRGVLAYDCTDMTINRCTIVVRQGTAITVGTGCSGALIQLCWLTEEDYLQSMGSDWLDPTEAHQSGISIRSSDVTIKQCLLTHIGGSGMIRTYPWTSSFNAPRYDDIVIENCCLVHNDGIQGIALNDFGYGCRITNCTVLTRWRQDGDDDCAPFPDTQRFRYEVPVFIKQDRYSVPSSEVRVENSVIMGILNSGGCTVEGTVMYSRANTNTASAGAYLTSNWVFCPYGSTTCGGFLEMESGFFAHTGGWDLDDIYDPVTDWDQVPDMRLVSTAKAWNFGLVSLQPTDSLPQVGADGRLELTWPTRSSTAHDAGAYQH